MPDLYDCEEAWYCFKSLPKKEHLAATLLRREVQLEALAPRIRFTRRTRTGKKSFVEALFPGYLFARTTLKVSYRQIISTHGIRSVVSYGNIVPAIPDCFMEELRNRLPADDSAVIEQAEATLQAGQAVSVTEGPFIHWQGMITGMVPAQDRVRVLLELLGRQLNVELPAHSLMARS